MNRSHAATVRERQHPLRERYQQTPSAALITDRGRTVAGTAHDPFHGQVVPGSQDHGIQWAFGVHSAVGGYHDGPNPGDLLCAALAACLDSTLRIVAERFGVALRQLAVDVTADVDVRGTLVLDRAVPVGFQRMRCRVSLQPEEGTDPALLQKVLAAAEHSCVNLQTLRGPLLLAIPLHDLSEGHMMRRLPLAVLVSIVMAVPAFAQTPESAPRAIPLPDTMGANFAAADTLTGTSGAADYDFLVGTWRFSFQARRRDGSFTPAFTGHWVFTKKQTGGQGVLLEDHWRPDDPNSTWDAGTWTYRAYNPERRIWEMRGINTNIGAWQPGLMWTAGDSRLLTEWYGPMLVRFRYFAIQPDQFLWRADATFDGGKTWIADYWTMEVHRLSR